MGRDKALLPFRGGPLAQSVARAVEEAASGKLSLLPQCIPSKKTPGATANVATIARPGDARN